MREIKFRAWIKRKNELIYLRGFRYSGNEKIKITFADEDKDDCTYTFLNKDVCLEQFTGLRDKNGLEIYEGDVAKYFENTGVVKFVKDGFAIDWDDVDCCNREDLYFWATKRKIEIIGNIHEVHKYET